MDVQDAATWPVSLDRQVLVRCLGMMGSTHDGEALNAARIADNRLRKAGVTWADVINPKPAASSQPSPRPSPHPTGRPPAPPPMRNGEPRPAPQSFSYIPREWPTRWRWLACACVDSRGFGYLHPADKKFLRAIAVYRSTPSCHQLWILRAIADHVLREAAAA
jgi:hypothetical protein